MYSLVVHIRMQFVFQATHVNSRLFQPKKEHTALCFTADRKLQLTIWMLSKKSDSGCGSIDREKTANLEYEDLQRRIV